MSDIFEDLGLHLTDDEKQQIKAAVLAERFALDKERRREGYRRLNRLVRPHQILFVGSSLMELFPIYELLLDRGLPYIIYNRGISGTTTQELLGSMDECIFALQPDHIYINIGTNDLNGPDASIEELIGRYRLILTQIRERLPETKLNLLAYYPVNPEAARGNPRMEATLRNRTNEKIRRCNEAVKALAEEFGARYLDLNAGITDEQGRLKAEYTIEGMHMYGDGYARVLDALLPYLPEC